MSNQPQSEEHDPLPPGLATQENRGWRYLVISLVVVSALFSGFTAGMLVLTQQEIDANPLSTSPLLLTFKRLVDANPQDAALKKAYAAEDARVLALDASRQSRMDVGGPVLVLALVVLVASLKWYVSLDGRLPAARKSARPDDSAQRKLRWGGAVALLAVMLLLVGVIAAFHTGVSPAAWFGGSTDAPGQTGDPWPSFRGPTGMGIVPAGDWPVEWDVKSGKNIAWKVELPFLGASSPIVWGNRVFVTAANEKTQYVLCYSVTDGTLLWDTEVISRESKRLLTRPLEEQVQVFGDSPYIYAASTPVTDGRRVYALFATADVVALDFDGNIRWLENFGKPDNQYGLSASLAIHEKTIIFLFDQSENSAIIGLDPDSGGEMWRNDRPGKGSWSSPIVAKTPDGPRILTAAAPYAIAYDADSITADEVWRLEVLDGDVAASPIYAGGHVIVASELSEVTAIATKVEGDKATPSAAWTAEDGLSDTPSPVSDGKLVLMPTSTGSLVCYNIADGKKVWEGDANGGIYSSPSLVGDTVYLFTQEGKCLLFKLPGEYKVIRTNDLGEEINSSPAFSGGRIFIRGEKHLFCIASDATAAGGK